MGADDRMDGITFGFMLVPMLAYAAVIFLQSNYVQNATFRLTVLSTRAALFLPGYAFLMWLTVLDPNALSGLTVLVNAVEGYSFYSFFGLLVHNLGGPAKTIELMKASGKKYALCSCCFPPSSDKEKFYNRVWWVMFHMMVTRVIFSIFACIGYYSGTGGGKVISLIFQILNAVIVFMMVIHIVNFYEMLYTHTVNLFGLIKVLLLKMSVGLIVLEGLITNFLIRTGKTPYSDDDGDDHYDGDEKTVRGYAALVLIELMILSVPYFYAYGFVKIRPSQVLEDVKSEAQQAGITTRESSSDPTGDAPITFRQFYCEYWVLQDVFFGVTARKDLEKPLTGGSNSSSRSASENNHL
mmetsp:Transcript_18815/g.31501  ORF Transcript_18815/g.31501 Transcript_18815/m.31501 type:complete len:353 (-) Transcript_18815:377-1435(-)